LDWDVRKRVQKNYAPFSMMAALADSLFSNYFTDYSTVMAV